MYTCSICACTFASNDIATRGRRALKRSTDGMWIMKGATVNVKDAAPIICVARLGKYVCCVDQCECNSVENPIERFNKFFGR